MSNNGPELYLKVQISSPPGTDPITAATHYAAYLITGEESEGLARAAVGSFTLYIGFDSVDCVKCSASIRVWAYNSMSKSSFGRFADVYQQQYNDAQREQLGESYVPVELPYASQHMWWSWTQEVTW